MDRERSGRTTQPRQQEVGATRLPSLVERICDDYESGMSLASVASAYGMGTSKVRRILVESGVTIRPAHAPRGRSRGHVAWFTITPEIESRVESFVSETGVNKSLLVNASLDIYLTLLERIRW